MLKSKSFLSIDFGAGSLKMAEFDTNEAGVLRLRSYAVKPLGLAGSQDSSREGVILRGLQELLGTKAFAARRANVCAAGFHTFAKFVKLPPVDTSKVTQIIQYEAQQNVPFPLEEVVWDYQILGTSPAGELEVLLTAIKSDVVESLFRAAEANGLRLDLVDVSPAALCNAFRYNYGDLEGCSMLLDIGAKTSNVLFFEKDKVFSRGINIGANSITQDFAAESKTPFAEAEKFKLAEGFVSLGGAYEEPDNPRQAAISKIARQVMTRLHIQVNQTIQFYRGQQGGGAPARLFLCGGASIMPYTAQFFAEKLNVAVEYFNPFRNVQIDPSVNIEELAKVAHGLGEVVGLGLRNPTQCPIELNLMPKSILKRQQLSEKKPYFFAAAFSLILVVFAIGWFYDRLASIKESAYADMDPRVTQLKNKETQFNEALGRLKATQAEAQQIGEWIEARYRWADILAELRRVLAQTEAGMSRPGMPRGIWVEKMVAEGAESLSKAAEGQEEESPRPMMDIRMMMRYGLLPPGFKVVQTGGDGAEGGGDASGSIDTATAMAAMSRPTPAKPAASTNEITVINVTCKGISYDKTYAAADKELANSLLKELLASPLFEAGTNGTALSGQIQPTDNEATFTFDVRLKLKAPIKL